MSKERDIEILEDKIVKLDIKIENFLRYNISDLKREKLEARRAKYEQQLADLQS